jgi:hypothetical protein
VHLVSKSAAHAPHCTDVCSSHACMVVNACCAEQQQQQQRLLTCAAAGPALRTTAARAAACTFGRLSRWHLCLRHWRLKLVQQAGSRSSCTSCSCPVTCPMPRRAWCVWFLSALACCSWPLLVLGQHGTAHMHVCTHHSPVSWCTKVGQHGTAHMHACMCTPQPRQLVH